MREVLEAMAGQLERMYLQLKELQDTWANYAASKSALIREATKESHGLNLDPLLQAVRVYDAVNRRAQEVSSARTALDLAARRLRSTSKLVGRPYMNDV